MKKTSEKETPSSKAKKPRMLFGAIAVRKGFISEAELEEALARQKQMVEQQGKHELIGLVMLEMGFLSNAQLIEILKYIEASTGHEVD